MTVASQSMMHRPRSSDTLWPRLATLRHAGSFARCSGSSSFAWLLLAGCILVVSEESSIVSVLAERHNCSSLQQAVVDFMRDLGVQDMAIQEWMEAVVSHPSAEVESTSLPVEPPTETSAPATAGSEATPTTWLHSNDGRTPAAATPPSAHRHTVPLDEEAVSFFHAQATTGSEAATTTQPYSNDVHTAAAATSFLTCPGTAPLDDAAVSHLQSLSGAEKGWRLLQAAKEGPVEEVRALIAAGADVGARDGNTWTALHHAAWWGRVEVARCLLQAGAEVDVRNKWQATPLLYAADRGRVGVARLLLAASADPDARNKFGVRPLHWAAYYGHAEVATALLEAGADKGAKTNAANTPLDLARVDNHQQLIKMLETH